MAIGIPFDPDNIFQKTGLGFGKPQVELSWTASTTPFAVKYRVEFKLAIQPEFRLAGETVETKFQFNSLIPGAKYDFRVTAVSGGFVESTPVTASLTTQTFLPGPPGPIPK